MLLTEIVNVLSQYLDQSTEITASTGGATVSWDRDLMVGGNNAKMPRLTLKARLHARYIDDESKIPHIIHVHKTLSDFDAFMKDLPSATKNLFLFSGEDAGDHSVKDIVNELARVKQHNAKPNMRFFFNEFSLSKRVAVIYTSTNEVGIPISEITALLMIDEKE